MTELPGEWKDVKAIVSRVLHERAGAAAPSWLDEAGGYGCGWSFRRNREMLDRIMFRMQLIHSVEEPDLTTTVLGNKLELPILIAPMSETLNVVSGPESMAFLGRGARIAGTATSIGHPVSEAAMLAMAQEGAPLFRAIKPLRDRAAMVETMREAERAGCFAIAIDVDAQMGLNAVGYVPKYTEFVRPLSAGELKELRQETSLPFVLKGITSVQDARAAVDIGADAIVVSNHGGHIFDFGPATVEMLPEISSAVGQQAEVWFDSGVRRGTDVLKALAFGAKAVLVGRLAIWGLALGGAEGVAHILDLLATELRRTMLLTGVSSVTEVPRDLVAWAR
jgi:4-hydroxymandelate oxidase